MKPKTLQRIHLREATVLLVAARLAVRLIPAARLLAWASRPPRRVDRFAADEIARVSWAVETIARRRWMRAHSLPRSLAAQIMLRRRGVASRLCLGIARDGAALTSHAWLEAGERIVIGGDAARRATRLAQFGAERP